MNVICVIMVCLLACSCAVLQKHRTYTPKTDENISSKYSSCGTHLSSPGWGAKNTFLIQDEPLNFELCVYDLKPDPLFIGIIVPVVPFSPLGFGNYPNTWIRIANRSSVESIELMKEEAIYLDGIIHKDFCFSVKSRKSDPWYGCERLGETEYRLVLPPESSRWIMLGNPKEITLKIKQGGSVKKIELEKSLTFEYFIVGS